MVEKPVDNSLFHVEKNVEILWICGNIGRD